jgi:hypothetical protein
MAIEFQVKGMDRSNSKMRKIMWLMVSREEPQSTESWEQSDLNENRPQQLVSTDYNDRIQRKAN